MNKSLETVLKALEHDALAFCSESDWAIVVAECEKAGNVRRISKSAQVILQKAMSRSEAGRFAAEQRWKGHVPADRGSQSFAQRRAEAEQRVISPATWETADFVRDLKVLSDETLQEMWSGRPKKYSSTDKQRVGAELVERGLLYEDPEGPSGRPTLPEIDRSPSEPNLELEALVERIRAGKIARGENPNENSNDAYNELEGSDPNLPENQVGNYTDQSLLYGLHDKNNTVEYKQKMASELLRRGYGVDDIFGVSDDGSGGRLPNPPGSSERKMVPADTMPRGSGVTDDGEQFNGKFSDSRNEDHDNNPARSEYPQGTKLNDLPVYSGERFKSELKAAQIFELVPQIMKMYRQGRSHVPASAKPYLVAMNQMSSVHDMYGADTGKTVIAYAISNIKFQGVHGRALKAELEARLKEIR